MIIYDMLNPHAKLPRIDNSLPDPNDPEGIYWVRVGMYGNWMYAVSITGYRDGLGAFLHRDGNTPAYRWEGTLESGTWHGMFVDRSRILTSSTRRFGFTYRSYWGYAIHIGPRTYLLRD